jgi:hypothetical protein
VNTASQAVTTGLANSGARKVVTKYAILDASRRPNSTATHDRAIHLTDFSDVCACVLVPLSIITLQT